MIIPEGYAQVNMRFTGTSLPTGAEITFGVQPVAPVITVEDIEDVVFDSWVTAGISANLVNTVSLTSILVKAGPNATGAFIEVPHALPGGVASPCVPANSSALVTKVTPFGGRAGRGRFYLPGIQENGVAEDGRMDGTLTANIQADMTTFLEALDTADCAMVVLHGAGSPITTPTSVNALVVQRLLATQRRRLRR